jgi:hypothetical protein
MGATVGPGAALVRPFRNPARIWSNKLSLRGRRTAGLKRSWKFCIFWAGTNNRGKRGINFVSPIKS